MRSSHSDRPAFTLVELLAVVAIIAILLVVTVPALKSIQGTAMQVASRQVSTTIQLARQTAIARRAHVRFCIAVDTSSGAVRSDLICRAYTVSVATNDADGNVFGWIPLQDWQFLPDGIVFSDLNNQFYDTIDIRLSTSGTLTADTPPPLGANTRSVGNGGTNSSAWQWFDGITTNQMFIGGSSDNWITSTIEFEPTGYVADSSFSGSARVAGVRFVQGTVLDPATRNILVTDTNNWTYVEYDGRTGRVRVRSRDSYTYKP